MIIAGLEKFTLLDYPEKIACTIFLFGCNFRCGYCHNPELVLFKPKYIFSEEEVLSFLDKRRGQLEAVCFTGGEPLLTLKKEFVRKIKELGYLIKIDTNGSNPERLKEFLDENLVDFIAMDLKSSDKKYLEVVNIGVNFDKISKSIEIIVSSKIDYEFRTTVLKKYHDFNEIDRLGFQIFNLIKKKPKKYVLQGFINQGKFIDSNFINEQNTRKEYLLELKKVAEKYFEKVEIRV
jgi:pyruvate formate lyase activating enzyme